MPLPTRSSVETLDYSLGGQPAAVLEAKSLNSGTLDYSQYAQPVSGIASSSVGPDQGLTALLFTNTQTFYGPSTTNLNTLLPPMFADSDFVFPPTVASVQPQPVPTGGSLVRPRRKFRPAILFDLPEPEIVLPDADAKVILAGLSVTVQLGSVIAKSPDPINSRAKVGFTQIEAYTSGMVARSSWNDPNEEELLFILDYALN